MKVKVTYVDKIYDESGREINRTGVYDDIAGTLIENGILKLLKKNKPHPVLAMGWISVEEIQ